MASDPFVVVGAGMGGLATALRLAHRREKVVIFEKTDQIGGRNRAVSVNDCQFDGGPTLLMMLDPFRRLFADVGERLEDHLDLQLCDPSYRVFFSDGSRLDATTNMALMVRQIENLAGREDSLAYPTLIGDLADLYRATIPNFVQKNFYGPQDFFGPKALALVKKHRMLGNLASGISRYVKDERLRMLFSFQTMYLGLSPYQAPWVYAVLTYMEYGEGIWYPKGGIVEIARAIARLAQARGVDIRLNSAVSSVARNRVQLESGDSLKARAVIVNADLPYAERELVGQPAKHKARRSSCSAYMMYIDYAGALPDLQHHNVFFGSNFKANLDAIFNRLQIPDDPAFYAAISRRSDSAKAPEGHENLYILIPCPNLDRPWDENGELRLRESVFDRLQKEVGFERSRINAMSKITPEDWRADLNLDRGAAFGLSHDFWQSAYFRPSNRSRGNRSVYYVGASTIPGNGLPMVLTSAQLLEERLKHDGFLV